MSGKLAFRSALQGKNQGNPPFVPFVYGLAARASNVSLRDMTSDPGYYTSALEGLYKLFNYEVIATGYDTTIENESWGGQVEWGGEYGPPVLVKGGDPALVRPEEFLQRGKTPVLLEATKRLVLSAGRDAAIGCVLSGPCSLLTNLRRTSGPTGAVNAEAAKNLAGFLNKLVRGFCELKVDAVFFREDPLGRDLVEELTLNKDVYKGVYATLFNIVRAFNGFPILVTDRLTLDAIKTLHGLLRPDGIVLLGTDFTSRELRELNELADTLKTSFGLPLPIGTATEEALWGRLDVIKSVAAAHGLKRLFYTSEGEIPYDIPMEVLHALMDRLTSGTARD